jgi:hypothetical protein
VTGPAVAQEEEVLLLDDLLIKGQVREPSVEIISSRLQPTIRGFRLEKSFLDQARRPDEELVDVDPLLGREARLASPDALLSRPRVLRPGLKTPPVAADQEGAARPDGNGATHE